MAWFWRGAQSAFFYYVSCAPCANLAFERRRAKEKARADKETKELMKNASRHTNGQIVLPDEFGGATQERVTGMGAFTTNIYWQEDIELGPHPRKGKHRSNYVGNTGTSSRPLEGRPATVRSVNSTGTNSVDTLQLNSSREEPHLRAHSPLRTIENRETSHRKRYQRPDEALWGEPVVKRDWGYFARGRNPEINSLCPPVVSTKPANSEQAIWMLQPPPFAKMMEGSQTTQNLRSYTIAETQPPSPSKYKDETPFVQIIRRPDKVHLCTLGERMTDLHEFAELKGRRTDRQLDGIMSNYILNSEPQTPKSRERKGSSSDLSTEWMGQGSEPLRDERSLMTPALQQSSPREETKRDSRGFDPAWTFPRRYSVQTKRAEAGGTALDSFGQTGGYSSEPELPNAEGVSFQDFASSSLRARLSSQWSRAPHQAVQSKPRSPSSRPQSDSNSSDSRSSESSTSSLHALEELVTLHGGVAAKSESFYTIPQSLESGPSPSSMEGQLDVNPSGERWHGGREFRFEKDVAQVTK